MKKILKHKKEVFFVLFFVVILALIRFYQKQLFYDPFLDFFKGDYHNQSLPQFNSVSLGFSYFVRYLLNSISTLAILYVLFKDFKMIKFATSMLAVFFIVLLVAFYFSLYFFKDYLVIFYIRRFLIQPLFLLLFLPAFYFQKKSQKNDK
ncbi:exosortase F system-associated protein [Flavobacterium sp.]|uniref:exosortase F system-associated membrane protein n=1 Tax=Flavobacterium sp. TaxID=239 RepID=UPI003528B1B6